MEKFKLGDLVRLKSGGPVMTVARIESKDYGFQYRCVWMSDNHQYANDFLEHTLVAIEREEDKEL